jgi:hypothetical protein
MIEILYAVLILIAVYAGYKMGKGEDISIKKPRFMARTEEQEKALLDKREKAERVKDGRR